MRFGAKPDKNLANPAGVLSLMQFKSVLYGDRTAFYLREDGLWKETTYLKLAEDVRGLSDYLIAQGVERGDRIAILAESRPEWAVAFFAAIRSGAVVVPIDIKLTREEHSSILADAEPRFLFVSTQMLQTARDLQEKASFPMSIVVLNQRESDAGYTSLAQLRASTNRDGIEREYDETAMIVYTSGTTGSPKGVMISFRNLGYQVMNVDCVMKLTSNDVILSMLPLNTPMLSENELWILSFYRTSEISGALFFGKLAKSMKPGEIQRDMTKHFSDEALHSWYWTSCIERLGAQALKLSEAYQDQYLAAAGMPVNLMEVLAITQIFEKRVVNQYARHSQVPGLQQEVSDTLAKIMIDEKWHIEWIHDALKKMESEYGKDLIEATLKRFWQADQDVYSKTMQEHEERIESLISLK